MQTHTILYRGELRVLSHLFCFMGAQQSCSAAFLFRLYFVTDTSIIINRDSLGISVARARAQAKGGPVNRQELARDQSREREERDTDKHDKTTTKDSLGVIEV